MNNNEEKIEKKKKLSNVLIKQKELFNKILQKYGINPFLGTFYEKISETKFIQAITQILDQHLPKDTTIEKLSF